MKTIYKFLILLIIVSASFFAGYENPEIVSNIKSLFVNKETPDLKDISETSEIEYEGNSFSIFLNKEMSLEDKTASIYIDDKNKSLNFEIFTQNGFLLKNNSKKKILLPKDFYDKEDFRNGGIKAVIKIKKNYFALISRKKESCFYASLINVENLKKIFSSRCIPDKENIDFNGLGGAYTMLNEDVLLTVGAPEWNSPIIANLAQDKKSIFGKIILIANKSLSEQNLEDPVYEIFSQGHKNPQGLVRIDDNIFSLEHGPQGGDELNLILKEKNYGWPKVSLGTKYNYGASYEKSHKKYLFSEPLYSFLPSVAPSALQECPNSLSDYYNSFICLIGLTLKEESILIFLLDKETLKVTSVEKIKINKRLRHFGLKKNFKLFENNGSFYISADIDGLYRVRFGKFR
tara:strand:+ start:103 stop:1311 length:1209 start_codon:yes stop_codon:yes gene_type:complete